MGPQIPGMALWKKILFAIVVLLALLIGAAFAWWSANGRDFVWSKIQPRDAALLAGQEIPDTLPAAAWAEDLDFLVRELPRRFVRFDQAVDGSAYGAEAAAVRQRLPGLSRQQKILDLMGIAALPGFPGGTGHTGISPFQRPLDWRIYPYSAWLFDDGVWITLTGSGAEEARGAEILAIGGRPIRKILHEMAPFVSADNPSGLKERLATSLSFAEMLQALGVVGEDGAAELTLRKEGGEPFTLRVAPVHLASLGGLRWGSALQTPVDTVQPADPRPRAHAHRLEYRPDSRLLYLQLNEIRDEGDETFAALADKVRQAADEHEIDRFVLDLRANGGGNNQLIEPLVAAISGNPRLDRRGVLYTLIGRRTFSAAGNLASALERRTKTLFAGEPSGFTPNQYGDAVRLPLPRSKIIVRISTRYWGDGGPYDHRPWIEPSAPDLAPRVTHADFFAGRDPVLEAVLAHRVDPVAEAPLDPVVAAALRGRYRFDLFRVLTIGDGSDGQDRQEGGLHLEIRGARIFASSDLYPQPPDGSGLVRCATDLSGVTLTLDSTAGTVSLDWRGEAVPLPPEPDGERTPIDRVRDGDPQALHQGIAAFRSLAAAGHVPDSWTEMELNRIGYQLLEAGRTDDAIEIFRLQTELYPEVANSFDSLGDAYRKAGDTEQAAEAYRSSLERDPGFDHSRRMLDELTSG